MNSSTEASFAHRGAYYEADTRSYLGLSARNPLSVQTSDPAMGTVVVNTLDLSTRMTTANTSWTGGYWGNVPVTLTAEPKPGYRFVGWQNGATDAARSITVSAATGGRTYRAVFAVEPSPAAPTAAAIGNQTATTGVVVALPVAASDPNGYPLSYQDKDLPSGLSIHPVTGMIYGKPTKAGTFASTITVSDGVTSTKLAIAWTVSNALDRVVTLPTTITGDGTGLTGEYYATTAMTGTPLVTRVENPAVDVGSGGGPVAGTGSSGWAIRWTGYVSVPTAGTYTLAPAVRSDDGIRIRVGDRTVLDAWTSGSTTATATVDLPANSPTPIVIEFTDRSGAASLAMRWSFAGQATPLAMEKGVFTPATG